MLPVLAVVDAPGQAVQTGPVLLVVKKRPPGEMDPIGHSGQEGVEMANPVEGFDVSVAL